MIERRVYLYGYKKTADMFMELYNLLNDCDEMPYSFKFYHGVSAQRKKDAYLKSIQEMLENIVQEK